MKYGIRRDEVNVYAYAIGTYDGEEIHEVVTLPKSFDNDEAIEALSDRVFWLTPQELASAI